MDICAEKGVVLGDTFFQYKLIHRYTWRTRSESGKQKSIIDYIALIKMLKKKKCAGCKGGEVSVWRI